LASTFRFDKDVFQKVKGLTGASLIITLSTILFYELDQVVISNVLGIEAVAIYAIGLSVLQLVRTFCSIVYSPYTSRYNHFVGLNDYAGLTNFVNKMVILFAPVLIVPILTLSLSAEPFILSWVGEQYNASSVLVSFMVLSFIYNFISDPISQYFIATESNHVLIKYNILLPLVYWIGIVSLISFLSIKAFAIMKFISPLVIVISYWYLISVDYKKRGYRFLNLGTLIKAVVPTVLIVILSSWLLRSLMVYEYSKVALFRNIFYMGLSVIISMCLSVPFNYELKNEARNFYKRYKH